MHWFAVSASIQEFTQQFVYGGMAGGPGVPNVYETVKKLVMPQEILHPTDHSVFGDFLLVIACQMFAHMAPLTRKKVFGTISEFAYRFVWKDDAKSIAWIS